jgi:hypothetical protein
VSHPGFAGVARCLFLALHDRPAGLKCQLAAEPTFYQHHVGAAALFDMLFMNLSVSLKSSRTSLDFYEGWIETLDPVLQQEMVSFHLKG